MVKKRIPGAVIILLLLPRFIYAQAEKYFNIRLHALSDHAVVVSGSSFNTNQLAVRSEEGIILIDTGISPGYAAAVRDSLEAHFGTKTFKYVINTHHHWDHVQGNQVFPEAVFIGHRRCESGMHRQNDRRTGRDAGALRIRLEGKPSPDSLPPPPPSHILTDGELGFQLIPPGLTVSARLRIRSGDIDILIFALNRFHTDNDLIVSFPKEGIAATGDLFFHHALPIIGAQRAADAERTVHVLEMILAGPDFPEHVVPGHGALIPGNELLLHRAYIDKLWKDVREASISGRTLQECQQSFKLSVFFPELTGFDQTSSAGGSLHAGNVEAVWNACRFR